MKRQRRNPLQIQVKAVSMPVGVNREEYVETLLESIGSGSLPEDWEIDLSWRNPETKKGRSANWQEGEFMEVVQSSSKGFTTVLKRILRQSLAKARREPLPRAKGKRRVFLGRSLANRKGWETRWKAGRSLGPKGRAFLERESERE